MSYYVIGSYDIDDFALYDGYVAGVVPILMRHGGQVIVGDFEATALEGTCHKVNVILRFPSEEAARAWYDDPEYAPLIKKRQASCSNNSLVLAKEFVIPE